MRIKRCDAKGCELKNTHGVKIVDTYKGKQKIYMYVCWACLKQIQGVKA